MFVCLCVCRFHISGLVSEVHHVLLTSVLFSNAVHNEQFSLMGRQGKEKVKKWGHRREEGLEEAAEYTATACHKRSQSRNLMLSGAG